MATWSLGLAVLAGSAAARAQYGPPQGPPGGYDRDRGGWDAPPAEFRDAARQGFRDGLEGARKDFGNHRRWNVNNRDEFRHPNIAQPLRRDYKMGFRRGYDAGVRHYMGVKGPR